MTKVMTKTPTSESVQVEALKFDLLRLRIIGTTPYYCNAMSRKLKEYLLWPTTKTRASRSGPKHDPEAEFRDSMYHLPMDGTSPTLLYLPGSAIKAALCQAALKTPGIFKTTAQTALFVEDSACPMYGVPLMKMDVVRNSDPNHTPDVRTRAFLPHWGTEILVKCQSGALPPRSVFNLAMNAGQTIGVGDFRQEKGKGNFGTFRCIYGGGEAAADDEAEWNELVTQQGRAAQREAFDHPQCADDETADLFAWYQSEFIKRGS
jgi:hypothetical protein